MDSRLYLSHLGRPERPYVEAREALASIVVGPARCREMGARSGAKARRARARPDLDCRPQDFAILQSFLSIFPQQLRQHGGIRAISALTDFPELNDFRDLVLAARALIRVPILTGPVGKDANENHSCAALWTTRARKNRWRNFDMCCHFCLPCNNWPRTAPACKSSFSFFSPSQYNICLLFAHCEQMTSGKAEIICAARRTITSVGSASCTSRQSSS